jgi:zinc protease
VAHRPEASKRDYRRLVGEQLYGMILQERFAILARRPEAPFLTAAGAIHTVTRDVDAFERVAMVKAERTEDALRALLVEVERIERHGVTPTELDRARANLGRMLEQAADREATTDSREFCDEISRNFFERELMIGRGAEKELTLAMLPTYTVDELNGLARAFAGDRNRVVLIAGPEGRPLPAKDRVLAVAGEVAKAPLDAWQDKAAAESLMATAPSPGRVVKEGRLDAIGVTEWTLSNGVRVIVKPTDFELDSVVVSAISPGGEAMASDADFPSARFAAEAAELGGAGAFDAEALGKVLAGKRARVSLAIDETTESVDASGSPRDLETLFQLLHLRMTAPRKDAAVFAVWQSNLAEQIADALRSPEVQFGREAQAAIWQGNRRRRPADPAEIRGIDLDRALAFYRDRFGDASDFTFVIVGDAELASLRPLVETYLGSLPGKGRKEREKDLGIRKVGGVSKKIWTLGREPKAAVRLDLHGAEPWTRDRDRDMYILAQVVSLRLREVLREDLGGVYGVGVEGRLLRAPHAERTFMLRFGCDPARVDELVQAALTELASIARSGIGGEYLEKVKQAFLRGRETDLRTNRFWAGWLTRAYHYGDDPALVLDTGPVVSRITSDHVKAAAKRYLDTKQYFQAVLLPATSGAGARASAP